MVPNDGFVHLKDYGLSQVPVLQALTPIDMHMPRIYGTRWILAFPIEGNEETGAIFSQLREALAYTAQKVPWICGNVVATKDSDVDRGRIEVRGQGLGIPFTFKDIATSEANYPTYVALKSAHFPLRELATSQLSPVGVLPDVDNPPAFAAQANFIDGGLLLTICAHHAVCDARGLQTVVQTWAHMYSALSHGGPPIAVDPTINDRTRLMEGLPGATVDEFPQYILSPSAPVASTSLNSHETGPTHHQIPPLTSRIFLIRAAALQSLKTAAAAYSSNDALTALVWRHISLARHGTTTTITTTNPSVSTDADPPHTLLLHAANIRSKLSPPLPPQYTGNATLAGVTRRLRYTELAHPSSGLATAAAAIRSSVKNLITDPSSVARIVGLIDAQRNPTDLKFAYHGFLGPDVAASSWVDLDVYGLEWGRSLGAPEAFRVPGEGGDGAVVVLPLLPGGDVEFMVALEEGAMKRLLGDEVFRGWVEEWA